MYIFHSLFSSLGSLRPQTEQIAVCQNDRRRLLGGTLKAQRNFIGFKSGNFSCFLHLCSLLFTGESSKVNQEMVKTGVLVSALSSAAGIVNSRYDRETPTTDLFLKKPPFTRGMNNAWLMKEALIVLPQRSPKLTDHFVYG